MVDNPGSGFSYRSPGVIVQRTRHISFFLAHFQQAIIPLLLHGCDTASFL